MEIAFGRNSLLDQTQGQILWLKLQRHPGSRLLADGGIEVSARRNRFNQFTTEVPNGCPAGKTPRVHRGISDCLIGRRCTVYAGIGRFVVRRDHKTIFLLSDYCEVLCHPTWYWYLERLLRWSCRCSQSEHGI
ncbi:hypothetical protein [Endozoicomonas sp. SESOKO1]|uniref:hypothetical protein n=1 Tax=Endozoicomonas sp. SESOKO1 TaxID=2828742 RepID=UPI0021485D44|nr:hypothetical protein [Endozoicomonas sp. SESOKO1]